MQNHDNGTVSGNPETVSEKKPCVYHETAELAYRNMWNTWRDFALYGYRRAANCGYCGEQLQGWGDLEVLRPETDSKTSLSGLTDTL